MKIGDSFSLSLFIYSNVVCETTYAPKQAWETFDLKKKLE